MSTTPSIAARLFLGVAGVTLAACAAPSAPDSHSSLGSDGMQQPELYLGQGIGGVIGLYLRDGIVLGGFLLPAQWNLDVAVARRLNVAQRRMLGGTTAWPMWQVVPIDDGGYRVQAVDGPFRLDISEVDRSALFYKMSATADAADVTYSGTAINVDAMMTQLSASVRGRAR
jgi:hypothetical protein